MPGDNLVVICYLVAFRFEIYVSEKNVKTVHRYEIMTERDPVKNATLWNVSQINGFVTEDNMQHLVFLVKSPCATAAIVCESHNGLKYFSTYSWVPNRRVYLFIWHPRNMKKETDTKTDKSI